MITKEMLLDELTQHTYVMLRPSKIAGIGVFALRPIPKGCREMFSKPDPNEVWITLSKLAVEQLPSHARELVENYCLFDANQYYVPQRGFKSLDVSLFLNHSESPNIISIEEGNYFETLRAIDAGEELLIDYGTIVAG
jgi:SET domain-containing protein